MNPVSVVDYFRREILENVDGLIMNVRERDESLKVRRVLIDKMELEIGGLRDALGRLIPALRTAAHLMRLQESYDEEALFLHDITVAENALNPNPEKVA